MKGTTVKQRLALAAQTLALPPSVSTPVLQEERQGGVEEVQPHQKASFWVT